MLCLFTVWLHKDATAFENTGWHWEHFCNCVSNLSVGVLPTSCWERLSHLVWNSWSHYWIPVPLCRKPHRLVMGRDPSALNEKSVTSPLTWVEKAIRGQGSSSSVMRHAGMFCLLVTARSLRLNSDWEGRASASAAFRKHCGSFLVP